MTSFVKLLPEMIHPDLKGEYYIDTLQRLHKILQPKSYLEIGVFTGQSLALARCRSIGIDPLPRINEQYLEGVLDKPELHLFSTGSDDFFAAHNPVAVLGMPVDLAFLDGMHRCEFLLRDIINTERACKPNSVIVLHDCLPVDTGIVSRDPDSARIVSMPHRANWWAGDTWRTSLLLRRCRPDMQMTTLDSGPTGLVLVTNLDPSSTALSRNYAQHVETMLSWNLTEIGIGPLFAEMQVTPTAAFQTSEHVTSRFWL